MNKETPPARKNRPSRSAPAGARFAVNEESLQDLVEFFQLLADRSRLRIVLTLAREGEQNVSMLCSRLGQSQPAVSHHLIRLRRRGLLSFRRDGKHNYYALMPGQLSGLLEPLLNHSAAKPGQNHLGTLLGSLCSL